MEDLSLDFKKGMLQRDVESFRKGAEIYYQITLAGLKPRDQQISREEVQMHIIPSMLVDPDLYSDETAFEISNGDFSSLNPLGLIHMVGYSSGSADGATRQNQKSPGELVDKVNEKMPLKFGRWI